VVIAEGELGMGRDHPWVGSGQVSDNIAEPCRTKRVDLHA